MAVSDQIIKNRVFATRLSALAAFAMLLVFPFIGAEAGIKACKLPDGSVVYQDSACPKAPKKTASKKRVKATIPFSIEKSWFDQPPVVPDRASCTKTACHCDMYSREFKSGLTMAVAEALYLDGSWHRLNDALLELEWTDGDIVKNRALLLERDEAACNILMSQKTLRLFGEDVVAKLRKDKRYAEDHGLDSTDDCDAGDSQACKYTDKIALYQRIKSDISLLQNSSRPDTAIESAEHEQQ